MEVLVEKLYLVYKTLKPKYDKMYEYYKGNTDAMNDYLMLTDRSNSRTNINYLKKFIKEEVSYSLGNEITYTSKSGNEEIVNDIDYYLEHWNEDHDGELLKKMLIFSESYEVYYVDDNGDFSSKIIKPTNGYLYCDEYGVAKQFINVFILDGDEKVYIDLYTSDSIYHFDSDFKEVKPKDTHYFKAVPVGICRGSEEGVDDTLYKDIKGLQDAYETNLSDISNEISDFRNAYLKFIGAQIEDNDIPNMKKMGILQFANKDADAEWLIKNINDTFIQNTLNTLEDKMYQMACHINHNESMQSNLSGLALRSRLIALEQKCKLNQKSVYNCVKTRLKFLFIYLDYIKNISYDSRDVKAKFTPNIPQDDLVMSQIISQLGDKLSTETGLAQLSFIDNPANELEKLKKENSDSALGQNLLNGAGTNGQGL